MPVNGPHYHTPQPMPSAVNPHMLSAGYHGQNQMSSQSLGHPINTSRLFTNGNMNSIGSPRPMNSSSGGPRMFGDDNMNHGMGMSQNSAMSSFPNLDTSFLDDLDLLDMSPDGGDCILDEGLSKEEQASTRKQRRIASERRYRERTDCAFTELIEAFELWKEEFSFPTKKTKEAQLRHAARLIK